MLGFLGTNAPFAADLTLVLSLAVLAMLIAGAMLAIRKQYTAHQWCQSAAVVLNLGLVLAVMARSFGSAVAPELPANLSESFAFVSTIHAVVGTLTVLMGLYMVLRGNNLVPRALAFRNYKPWMRTTLVLYILSTTLGVWTYTTWYLA